MMSVEQAKTLNGHDATVGKPRISKIATNSGVRWTFPLPRHERQQTGISARQQKRRNSAAMRAASKGAKLTKIFEQRGGNAMSLVQYTEFCKHFGMGKPTMTRATRKI